MGTYVSDIVISDVRLPEITPEVPGTNFDGNVNPSSPWSLVSSRFAESSGIANTFLALLTDNPGYLQQLADSITAYPDTDIGDINYVPVLPANIQDAMVWYETAFPNTFYDVILAKLTADLVNGATGVGGTVEQDIYDRAQARQAIEEDKVQTEIEEYFSSTGFDLPTGALAARLQEHANGRAMRTLDLNEKIAMDEAERAQKNAQFALTASIQLDTMMREFVSKQNDRSLEYKKAVAAHILSAWNLYVEEAKGDLTASIAVADSSIKGYQAEYALRAEVAKALTNVAMQAFSSSFGAVNTSAGMNYSGSESLSESWQHSESKSHSTGVTLSGSVDVKLSNDLDETHTFQG